MLESLLEEAALRPAEVETRARNALDPRHWERLCPGAAVERARPVSLPSKAPTPASLRAVAARFSAEGWFSFDPVLPAPVLARMRRGVEAVRAAGWPPVFAFAYDDFWRVTRTPWVRRFLTHLLGEGYSQNARIWCYRVTPERGRAGWPPHVDGRAAEGRVTLWVPLTDATLDNGCMYVIPRDLAPSAVRAFTTDPVLARADVTALLQTCRALPARAGSVLGWNHSLVHWGSTCGRPEHPRVSIAFEFIARGTEPGRDERPLLDAGPRPPPLRARLVAIAAALLTYDRFEPGIVRFRALAERLSQRVA